MLSEQSSIAADIGSRATLPAETWLWTLVLVALIAWRVSPGFIPDLGDNDGFQYLRMADLALSGKIGYSDLIYFDAERSFGTIPAPMVTFPPGYALVIAFLGMFGTPLELAGLLISALAVVGCIPLLAWCGRKLGLSRGALTVVAVLFLANFWTLNFATAVMSEALFTFMVLGATALLLSAREHVARYEGWRWILVGLAFGLAYWVRYAGLFFVIALGCLAAGYALRRNGATAKGYATACAAAMIPVVAGIARNVFLVGNWRGGNEKAVVHPLLQVVVDTGRAFNTLLLGPGTLADTAFVRVAVLVFFGAGALVLLARGVRDLRNKGVTIAERIPVPVIDIAVLAVVYLACMFYAGLTSVISYGYRMMFPLMPLILLLVSAVLLGPRRSAQWQNRRFIQGISIAFAGGIALYVYLHLLATTFPPTLEVAERVPLILDGGNSGKSVRQVVQETAGQHGVIMANCGQALGYFLGHPTVALASHRYSQVLWDERRVYWAAKHFGVKAIVIATSQSIDVDEERNPSTFVRGLAGGIHPAWLDLAFKTDKIVVYRFRTGV